MEFQYESFQYKYCKLNPFPGAGFRHKLMENICERTGKLAYEGLVLELVLEIALHICFRNTT